MYSVQSYIYVLKQSLQIDSNRLEVSQKLPQSWARYERGFHEFYCYSWSWWKYILVQLALNTMKNNDLTCSQYVGFGYKVTCTN